MSPPSAGPVITAGIAPSAVPPGHALAAQANARVSALPSGFPEKLPSGMAWIGSDFSGPAKEFTLSLRKADLDEITRAIESYKVFDQSGSLVSPLTFPLPTLGPKLVALRREIYEGKGFGVVHGVDPTAYSVEDLNLIYLGVQSYVAEQRGQQDRRGNMLVHIVADNSTEEAAEHHRHSTKSITFHTEEAGDIVSWLTRSTSATGGKCIIASAHTVYNVLAATRPDIIRTLAQSDWPFALPRFQCRPVIFYQDSRLIMNFGRTALLGNEAHPRSADLPSLTNRQAEALDAIEKIARATELQIQTQPGDMHFINNLSILHRREGFVDGDAPTEKRHLVRMRLRNAELGWSIPNELKRAWEQAFNSKKSQIFHLEPMPPFYFPLRSQPN